jgi:hypothetical protein
VGKNFNPAEFATTLRGAVVNSITIFANCHHGMAYYPTKSGYNIQILASIFSVR